MATTERLISDSLWLKERLDGRDGHLWRRARKMFLFEQDLSSALNLFKFDYKAIKHVTCPEGAILRASRNTTLDPDDESDRRPGRAWADDAKNSIRTLLDRIVTLWEPHYLYQSKVRMNVMHPSLSPESLRYVPTTFDDSKDDVDTFDVDSALDFYQECLGPLHYHELWHEIASDFRNVETTLDERRTTINVDLHFDKMTLDEEEETALVFGTNRVTYKDSYQILSNKLGLFDIVLMEIASKKYFGMIIHVEQTRVKVPQEDQDMKDKSMGQTHSSELKFELYHTIGIYVSRECSNAIKQDHKQTNQKSLTVTKLSNITSSRRVISAVNNLRDWPQHRSLLKPSVDDIYFQLPEKYDPAEVAATDNFNEAQSRTIAIADCMFDDLQERMHLVHGPPGTGKSRTIAGIVLKLLPKLPKKKKILLCAPSNNACNELCVRILDEFTKQDQAYARGTMIRVGCRPPEDSRLCDLFLDFMTLEDIVEVLKQPEKSGDNLAHEKESHLMRNAKIVVSTLNYCGSARMHPLRRLTEFIIIDEASQSSEGDSLLPLRFKCAKLMLVGDPNQLPPCILSEAGNIFGLSQSLFVRLYTILDQHGSGPISMLDTQYRMHPDICRFSSRYFYGGRLLTDASVATKMKHFSLMPLFAYDMRHSPHECDDAGSSRNEGEAHFVQYFCNMLIAHLAHHAEPTPSESEGESEEDEGSDSDSQSSNSTPRKRRRTTNAEVSTGIPFLPNNDPRSIEIQQRIAVITPYKAQVRLLRSYLPPGIDIMTADSSQGKEKDIVIVSCVRSGGSIGFLDDIKRMNVTLTRSKYALYVVGNLTQLHHQDATWFAFVTQMRAQQLVLDVDLIPPPLPFRDEHC